MRTITIDNENTIEKVKNYPVGDYIYADQENKEKIFEVYSGDMAAGMIDTLSTMYKLAKAELRNYFTLEEVWCIVRAFHSTSYEPSEFKPKDILIIGIGDCFIYEPHDELSQVGINTVIEKIKALSQFQCYTLLMMYFEFRNNNFEFETPYSEIKRAFMIEE